MYYFTISIKIYGSIENSSLSTSSAVATELAASAASCPSPPPLPWPTVAQTAITVSPATPLWCSGDEHIET